MYERWDSNHRASIPVLPNWVMRLISLFPLLFYSSAGILCASSALLFLNHDTADFISYRMSSVYLKLVGFTPNSNHQVCVSAPMLSRATDSCNLSAPFLRISITLPLFHVPCGFVVLKAWYCWIYLFLGMYKTLSKRSLSTLLDKSDLVNYHSNLSCTRRFHKWFSTFFVSIQRDSHTISWILWILWVLVIRF